MFAITIDTHDFTLDLHSIDAVGLGTLLLALATFWLAWKTRRLAKEAEKDRKVAQEQVDAARRQIELSQSQLERAHRPVVVPFQRTEDVKFRGGTISATQPHFSENPPDRTDLPRYNAVGLPVKSIGMGPALNLRGTFSGPRGPVDVKYPTEGVAAGEAGVVWFESYDAWESAAGQTAMQGDLWYDDVAGGEHHTEITFDIGGNAYGSVIRS